MQPLRDFDTVRVIRSSPTGQEDYPTIERPRAGDVGTVVDIRRAGTEGALYTVESFAADGRTVGLGDFRRDELEWIRSAGDEGAEGDVSAENA